MGPEKIAETYDAYYYAHGCGSPYGRSEEWLRHFSAIAERIVEWLQPRTALDAGCAMGFLVEMLRKQGVEAFGVDVSEYAIAHVHPDVQPYCWAGSVADPFPQTYDLIVCIEVLEHMPREDAERAVANFCRHTRSVLFSSTPFDYKEPTHINVQSPEHWAALFAQHGFYRDVDFDASFIAPWAVRFICREEPTHQLIRDYERRFWLLWKENTDLRSLTLEMRNQLAAGQQPATQGRDTQAQTLAAQLADRARLLSADLAAKSQALERAERRLAELDTIVGAKNAHIAELEQLIERIGAGRALKALRGVEATWQALRHAVAPRPGTVLAPAATSQPAQSMARTPAGAAPHPTERSTQRVLLISTDVVGPAMAGPGIRAWELARALAAEYAVTLAAPGAAPAPDAPFRVATYEWGRPGALANALASADVVVGQGFVFVEHPEVLASSQPLGIDLYDPQILESLHLYDGLPADQADAQQRRYLDLTSAMLRRGDFFFCATERQRDYWIGALSALGRVNAAIYTHDQTLRELIDLVPSGIPAAPPVAAGPALRGVHPAIGVDSLLLLWAGGLWEWFDPLLVIRAVAALQQELPRLRLCFFAGARPNPQGQPYRTRNHELARRLAAELGALDRSVIFLEEWIDYARRGAYLAEADAGVSAHVAGVETRFAFRTRLLDYLWARLPVVCSAGDSLGEQIAQRGVGLLVATGDLDGWIAALRRLHDDAALRAECRSAAVRLAEEFAWERVARPLAGFCRAARHAPDRAPA
jgi:glycosyltransferase involved in cell wall biosynthesis